MNKGSFARTVFWIFTASTVAAVATLFFLGGTPMSERDVFVEEGRPHVVATFYPLAEFSRMAGGDMVAVSAIVSPGVEPHDYEPTPLDMISIERADVFVMNGSGMDPWAEKLVPTLRAKGVIVVNASEAVTLLASEESDEHGREEGGYEGEAATEEERGYGAHDPHFWLDPVFAKDIVGSIRAALVERNPADAESYEASTSASFSRLAVLDEAYRTTLSNCGRSKIIASHNASAYLAKRYGFEVYSISGVSSEAEPSASRMAELTDLAKREDMRYIFFETLVSPKVSETLAREVGAETLVFDPIEGISPADSADGKDYFSIMESNLANLATALECRQ